MKIRMLKASICDGKRVAVGDVVDASDKSGRFLLLSRKAMVFDEPAHQAEEPEAEQPAEEAPKKRGRKRAPVNRMVEGDEIENRDLSE